MTGGGAERGGAGEAGDADTLEVARPLNHRVLLVEDDERVRRTIRRLLVSWNYDVVEADTITSGVQLMQRETPDLAIVDYRLPDGSAFEFLERAREESLPAVVLTGQGTIPLAVRAMQLGAEHFLTKPVDADSLQTVISRVLSRRRLDRQQAATRAADARSKLNPFIGPSPAIAAVRRAAEAVAKSDAPVLILGETGAGKGVLARWLHESGPRREEPFMDLNCSGLSKELVESELFGHQRGAFTGATATKKGLLEVAHRGTLFLDEIGDLDHSVQPKLLKVLEERTFRRVGEVDNRSVDVRLIAATHKDLEDMSDSGEFRRDLLFRINTVTIALPSLGQRREDIPMLAERILGLITVKRGARPLSLGESAIEALVAHRYVGNIRELRNLLERALIFHDGVGPIEARHLQLSPGSSRESPASSPGIPPSTELPPLEDAERELIVRALDRVSWKVDEAAKLLKIPRSTLYTRIKKLGIRR